eukprot:CAMPEP_0172309412 /NCGR_PEP_ID=MMETSP1058-20130122/9710_1 /TAXON_ID=83371 /ORGANISM="Detonula confervacea, Strain CCMP 353" /LENGTH=111 /DNA_ID=CAMNT_0013022031 /DNA_START=25 /DNA_END=357 /DNA_ORIENTATION=+
MKSHMFNMIGALLLLGAQAQLIGPLRGSVRGSGGKYKTFEDKGCRTRHGKKGSEHHEYYLYNHVSKHECKGKCDHLGSKCYGWEYSSSGKCEVWKVPINEYKLAYVHGLDC